MVDHSVGIITAICPYIGYAKAAALAKEAIESGANVRDLILRDRLLNERELQVIFDPYALTKPGIAGLETMVQDGKYGR